MSTTHRVAQGECLSSIAAAYGFVDYRAVYDHPDNAELKKKRPNPNVIRPGDRVVIPDREVKTVACAAGKTHRFQVKAPKTKLRVRLHDDDGKPYDGKRYVLSVDGQRLEGKTGGDGLVEHDVPASASRGELTVFLGEGDSIDGHVFALNLGHLDPPEDVSGAQARLLNLGYECPTSGALDDDTRDALLAFQAKNGLSESGALDGATVDKLRQLHEE